MPSRVGGRKVLGGSSGGGQKGIQSHQDGIKSLAGTFEGTPFALSLAIAMVRRV